MHVFVSPHRAPPVWAGRPPPAPPGGVCLSRQPHLTPQQPIIPTAHTHTFMFFTSQPMHPYSGKPSLDPESSTTSPFFNLSYPIQLSPGLISPHPRCPGLVSLPHTLRWTSLTPSTLSRTSLAPPFHPLPPCCYQVQVCWGIPKPTLVGLGLATTHLLLLTR